MKSKLQRLFVTKPLSILGEKLNGCWSDKLLKCPASRKPPALPNHRFPLPVRIAAFSGLSAGNIRKIHVALLCVLVPAKHGNDRFRKFCIIRLVDAARVYPEMVQTITLSL
jgi:hypothetical protein